MGLLNTLQKRNDGDPMLMENYEAFLAKLAKDIQQKATEQESLESNARKRSETQGGKSIALSKFLAIFWAIFLYS